MERSNPIDKLLGISSDPTGVHGQSSIELPEEMRPLYEKDGFFAFESALEVFPLSRSHKSYSLGEWNDENGWISFYQELRPAGILFAHNVFGDQFLFNDGVHIFDSETAEVSYIAESIESWAERLLGDCQLLTGQLLAHEWQVGNGPIPHRNRLVPITPFVLGGAFELNNLVAMDAMAGMRLRANLALQIKNLPDGASVVYEVV